MIVNFSLQDETGSTLPNLSFTDNGTLTLHALSFFVLHLGLANDLSPLDAHIVGAEAGASYFDVLRQGIADVIYSGAPPEGDEERGVRRPERDSESKTVDRRRRTVFEGLAGYAEKCAQALTDRLPPAEPPKESSPEFCWSAEVWELACQIRADIQGTVRRGADGTMPQSWAEQRLQELERLCLLLATCSHAYLLTILVPQHDSLTRRIVKMVLDSEITPIELYRKGMSRRVRKWLTPGHAVPISFSAWSSTSTHLEIEAPPETWISEVECRAMSTAPENHPPERMKYRASQNRTHVMACDGKFGLPLETIWVTLMPRNVVQPLLLALWALAVSACSLWWHFSMKGQSNPDNRWFTVDSVLALQTLSVALALALILTTGRHPIARQTWLKPIRLLSVAALLSVVPPLFLLAHVPAPAGRVLVLSHETISWILCGLVLSSVVAAILGFSWWRHSIEHPTKNTTEKPVTYLADEDRERRSGTNAMAITEVAPYAAMHNLPHGTEVSGMERPTPPGEHLRKGIADGVLTTEYKGG